MAISSPDERVYYYECNNGRFRLFCCIPFRELKALREENRISPDVLRDFPDGVDLGCTEADFREFEETYGYRLPQDPEALRRAFFAIFSTTHNWKEFRGSGSISAADVEQQIEVVDGALRQAEVVQEKVEPSAGQLPLRQLRQSRHRQARLSTRTRNVLQKLLVRGIDPKRTLSQQQFSPIKMTEGPSVREVFIRLHEKRRKEE